ncbi:MAG: hypothetical protein MZV63_14045 [Marinilabiliales bacterium]|nr:hypothetical protein [Marinilabiliales bacterium]
MWSTSQDPGYNDLVFQNADFAMLGPLGDGSDISFHATAAIAEDVVYSVRLFLITDDLVSLGNIISFTGKGSVSPGNQLG